jgi:nucleotide-binding universal stress UspA family protein
VPDSLVTDRIAPEGGVVVGDDGSACSGVAVRLAAQDAARRGCPLHIVRCWSMRTAPQPATWTPAYVPPLPDWEGAVRDELDRKWTRALAKEAAGVVLDLHPVHAKPGPTLVAASAGAELVVVGLRGRGELRGRLLGSVAEHVVHHAGCPVLVVRSRG